MVHWMVLQKAHRRVVPMEKRVEQWVDQKVLHWAV
jgi:hypothetical protein